MINPLLSKAKTDEVHGAGNVVDKTIKKSGYKDDKFSGLQEDLKRWKMCKHKKRELYGTQTDGRLKGHHHASS